MSKRVLIVDDHRIIRDGLRILIEQEPDLEVVAEAENGRQAIKMAQKFSPHVIIMDVAMPDMNGIDATLRIKESVPGVKIIALSMYSDSRHVLGMLEAGAAGYLLKEAAFTELAAAVHQVIQGHIYLSPQITDVVVEGYLNKSPGDLSADHVKLTPREREILQILAEGMTTKEIAAHLLISIKTVETHRRNIMEKLKIWSIAGLTKYAVKEGLVALDS
jgi:two-component system, NarL family, response regulator NreC